ncbi:hypothetical protein PVL29_002921 [Vitis rotundifolia]|uniref:Uncharacterized protein n=1 Tax=Vitis rotundifolia TaxID=103349 RepID=A0AA39E1E1_VITRO|nr:hypothetical protein PVL29_002921 [Vitis rotundifolia]
MISAKKLIKMARNWQKMTAVRRKRIILPRTSGEVDADSCSTSTAEKGHFVVYSSDESRFVVPLPYLNSNIFRELFKMSEEEFGLPSSGPITLPCDAVFIEYIISLVQQSIAKDLEKALLTAIATGCCLSTSNLCQEQGSQQLLICIASCSKQRLKLMKIVDNNCNTSPVADKGHFVVYTSDRIRFVVPLVYLDNFIFRELFQMAEEEFGLPGNGPIILPCDAVFMEYAVSLIQRHVAKDLEKALLMSIAADRCSSSSYFHQDQSNQQLLICGF